MNHQGTRRIETGRLVLRQFSIDDAEAMYLGWAGDPEVTRFMSWPAHESAEASRAVIEAWQNNAILLDDYNWCITLRESGEAIGSLGVVHIDEAAEAVQVGYCVGRAYWNQGFTAEALSAVIRFFFEEVGANRVEAVHAVENPASGRVMQKCGMTKEGVLREYNKSNQGLCDAAIYSILRREWQ
ncbi:GNAT family N-acetyltransferase [Eubacterium sp. 1001713B170207_170306_E7]|uniref:GNAT family N-acetyltransferase n=1 Tax=Eubacterium sp. 1001713B170207_170306_E7 TaxID=2787097 RepID=UPI00189C07A3|nr:GNAT family N-acetyltransferase [Eubacterium sp. 1001713B170207_170306_E7]